MVVARGGAEEGLQPLITSRKENGVVGIHNAIIAVTIAKRAGLTGNDM